MATPHTQQDPAPDSQADNGTIGAGHSAAPMTLPNSSGGKTIKTTSSVSGEKTRGSR